MFTFGTDPFIGVANPEYFIAEVTGTHLSYKTPKRQVLLFSFLHSHLLEVKKEHYPPSVCLIVMHLLCNKFTK